MGGDSLLGAAKIGLTRALSSGKVWICLLCVVAPLCWLASRGVIHEGAVSAVLCAMITTVLVAHGASDYASRRFGQPQARDALPPFIPPPGAPPPPPGAS